MSSSVLDQIREKVGDCYVADSCNEAGCKASLKDIPEDRILFDADEALPAHGYSSSRCDCILFFIKNKMLVAVPIELKSGSVKVSKVYLQLKSGTEFAANILDQIQIDNADCQPVLIHGGRLRSLDRTQLNKRKVVFRGRELTIKTARCKSKKSGNLAGSLVFDDIEN